MIIYKGGSMYIRGKNLFILIFSFLLISCSNSYIQKNLSDVERNKLILLQKTMKEELQVNNFRTIQENTKKTLRNTYIIDKIKDVDFTKVNIFTSKPVFNNLDAKSFLGINLEERTYYFEILYRYDDVTNKWSIQEFRERG